MELYERLGPHNGLDGCEKIAASTFIELLGLVNTSPGVARPMFSSQVVTDFYRETQDIVVATASVLSKNQLQAEIRAGTLFQGDARQLLADFGAQIWGDDRSQLIDASVEATDLYPKDLHINYREDYLRIEFYLRCWMAKRALRKASEGAKGGDGDVPGKRKRTSTSASAKKHKKFSDEHPTPQRLPPRSARKKPVSYHSHETEQDEDGDEEDGDEESSNHSSSEVDSTFSDQARPRSSTSEYTIAVGVSNIKKRKRPSTDDTLGHDGPPPGELSLVVRLPVDRTKLMVFEAWDGWKRRTAGNTQPSHSCPAELKSPTKPQQSDKARFGVAYEDAIPSRSRAIGPFTEKYSPTLDMPNGVEARSVSVPKPTPPRNASRPASADELKQSKPPIGSMNGREGQHASLHSPAMPSQNAVENKAFHPVTFPELIPEDPDLQRSKLFDMLISILESDIPSAAVAARLERLIDALWTDEEAARMGTQLDANFDRISMAFINWVKMHQELDNFRAATSYAGAAGSDWVDHRRSLTFSQRAPVLQAFNKLRHFRLEKKADGTWYDEETFDADLAVFFTAILQIPGYGVEDFADGFAMYNKELVAWFA